MMMTAAMVVAVLLAPFAARHTMPSYAISRRRCRLRRDRSKTGKVSKCKLYPLCWLLRWIMKVEEVPEAKCWFMAVEASRIHRITNVIFQIWCCRAYTLDSHTLCCCGFPLRWDNETFHFVFNKMDKWLELWHGLTVAISGWWWREDFESFSWFTLRLRCVIHVKVNYNRFSLEHAVSQVL